MSFKVNWPDFGEDFLEMAKKQLTTALNKGNKPANIVGDIICEELYMGSKAPELEILEIGDLTEERFRGMFKLVYAGDAYVCLQTKVQANPLNYPPNRPEIHRRPAMLAAHKPLVVPMRIRISNIRLRGITLLVVDKAKGVTLVFKNDPLEKVDVNSTFDNIPNIRRFLQAQIEGQLRNLFQDDLPKLIHNLSLVLLQKKEDSGGPPSTAESGSSSNVEEDNRNFFKEHGVDYPDINDSHSVDSGYTSEEALRQRVNLPHHLKWSGNEVLGLDSSEMDEYQNQSYVLYRSLGGDKRKSVGLKALFEDLHNLMPPKGPKPLSRPSLSGSPPRSLLSGKPSLADLAAQEEQNLSQSPAAASSSSSSTPQGPKLKQRTSFSGSQLLSARPSLADIEAQDDQQPQQMLKPPAAPPSISTNTPSVTLSTASNSKEPAVTNDVNLSKARPYSPPAPIMVPGRKESTSSSASLARSSTSSRPPYAAPQHPFLLHRSNSVLFDKGDEHSEEGSTVYTAHTSPNPSTQNRRFAPHSTQFQHHHSHNHPHNSSSGSSSGSRLSEMGSPQPPVEEFTERITLRSPDNEVSAHLASLMHAHHTISPTTHHQSGHATFRTFPHGQGHHHHHHQHHQSLHHVVVGFNQHHQTPAHQNGITPPSSPNVPRQSEVSVPNITSPINHHHSTHAHNSSTASSTATGYTSTSTSQRRRIGTRTVRKLKLPDGMVVPGLSPTPSSAGLDRLQRNSRSSSVSTAPGIHRGGGGGGGGGMLGVTPTVGSSSSSSEAASSVVSPTGSTASAPLEMRPLSRASLSGQPQAASVSGASPVVYPLTSSARSASRNISEPLGADAPPPAPKSVTSSSGRSTASVATIKAKMAAVVASVSSTDVLGGASGGGGAVASVSAPTSPTSVGGSGKPGVDVDSTPPY
ncbi:ERMES complex subunit [Chytridiales sp. JEL 0842]|nr:ERMES complex subunit [Chytridiales sp. JEL 0842]